MGEGGPAGAKGGASTEGKGGPLAAADQVIDDLQDPTGRFSAHICQRYPPPYFLCMFLVEGLLGMNAEF